MHQKKLDKPSANFTFLGLEASLNGILRVIFWRQRIEAKLVCGGSSVWSIAGGGTGDIHLSFCGSRARSWCGIISYQGKGATLLTKGQTNQNRSSRLFSKSVFSRPGSSIPILYIFIYSLHFQTCHGSFTLMQYFLHMEWMAPRFESNLTISSAKQNRLWIESREGLDSRIFWWDKPGWSTRTYSGEYSEETGVAQGGTQESMDHPQPVVLASANQGTSYSMQLSSLFRLMIITTITTISF